MKRASKNKIFIFLVTAVIFSACSGQKISVEEAKNIALNMRDESFVPPPRRTDDILSILQQPGNFEPEITKKAAAKANAEPPEGADSSELARFYCRRAMHALQIGRYQQEIQDLRMALHYAEIYSGQKIKNLDSRDYAQILQQLGVAESRYGDFYRGIGLLKRSLNIQQTTSRYYLLTWQYLEIGDYESAEATVNQGVRLCRQIKFGKKYAAWAFINEERMRASLLEAKGQFAEAEHYRRSLVKLMERNVKDEFPFLYIYYNGLLSRNLASQGNFIQAEVEARKALKEAIGLSSKNAGITGEIIHFLAYILTLQGRLDEAEKVQHSGIRMLQNAGLSYESTITIESILQLCKILVANQNFADAVTLYDKVKQSIRQNQFYYQLSIEQNPDIILALIKTNRSKEAMEIITNAFDKYSRVFGDNDYNTAEMLSLRGMAQAANDYKTEALKDLSRALPVLLFERAEIENDFTKKQRLRIIVEAFLNLIGDIYKNNQEKEFGINASAESFKLAQLLIDSSVQQSLNERNARAAATGPILTELVRNEQDAHKQIQALHIALQNTMAAKPSHQNSENMMRLKKRADKLTKARSVLLGKIQSLFPKYSDFVNPKPISFSVVQNNLCLGETLLVCIPTEQKTYVWSIRPQGPVSFHISDWGRNEIQQVVKELRKALDVRPNTFGDIPEFNITLSYDLYHQLLEPAIGDWKDTKDLIVVAAEPLGQIPFTILTTQPVKFTKEKAELFGNYRKCPWLINKASITRQPSVSAFVSLRKLPKMNQQRIAFVGFGNPIFNRNQLARAELSNIKRVTDPNKEPDNIQVRGIRISKKGNLDDQGILTVQLEDLKRLPDTEEEIKRIATIMNANSDSDVFLGMRASEGRVKSLDLSNRQVIAFASHALVPGDLDGLHQPAIALSTPEITGEAEDGLLTMEEVLKLNLNADWVVLSACNSGASDGQGAEAVSGLGQAFIYAGTKSILVSMWPVETTSARKLTTGLFKYQKENKTLSRAKSLQKSMLALINDPGFINESNGKVVASYAHPFFWAPFIVVGESGRTGD